MFNLVRGSKYQFDFRWKFSLVLLTPEFVEGFFFGDVPLDGGVGAGGAYGLDLVFSDLEQSFFDAFHLACVWVGLAGAFWFVRPAAFDGVGVAGSFGVDEGEAVVAVELDAVDDVGLLDGDSGDLLLVALGAGGSERVVLRPGRVCSGQGVMVSAGSVSPSFCSQLRDSLAAPGASRIPVGCGEGWLRGCCQVACLDGGVVGFGVGGWVFTIG